MLSAMKNSTIRSAEESAHHGGSFSVDASDSSEVWEENDASSGRSSAVVRRAFSSEAEVAVGGAGVAGTGAAETVAEGAVAAGFAAGVLVSGAAAGEDCGGGGMSKRTRMRYPGMAISSLPLSATALFLGTDCAFTQTPLLERSVSVSTPLLMPKAMWFRDSLEPSSGTGLSGPRPITTSSPAMGISNCCAAAVVPSAWSWI